MSSKLTITYMKKTLPLAKQLSLVLSLAVLLLFTVQQSSGQVNLYTVAVGTGVAPDVMNGFTPLFMANNDNVSSTVQNIGFNFTFNNIIYTQFSTNSNGLMRLGSTAVSTNAINQLTVNSDFPKIAPYWDDLNTGTSGYCGSMLTGVAPNRKLTIEWQLAIPKNSANIGRFQVWLYETSNVIKFVYSTGMNSNAGAYSVGLAASTTDFISVSPSAATATFSKVTENNSNTAAITSGLAVTFTPAVLPPACVTSSLPLAGSTGNSTASQLSWTAGGGNPTSYDVYFGTSSNPPLVASAIAATTFNPGALNLNTTYYYQIVPRNSTGPATGCSVNQFTTSPAINYNVNRNTGIAYSSILGTGTSATGWRNGTNTDDNMSTSQPIGFNFPYQGSTYNSFLVSTNGFITFNTATSNTGGGTGVYSYTNGLSDAGGTLIVAPFYEDLVCQGNSGSQSSLDASMKYALNGTAGNRILTIEWTGMETYNNPGPNLNFQAKLYEATGEIEFVYGTMEAFNGTLNNLYSYSLGINGVNISSPAVTGEYFNELTANSRNFGSTSAQLLEVPNCNTSLKFTPGAYVPYVAVVSVPTNDLRSSPQHLDVNSTTCTEYCGTYYSSVNATATPGLSSCAGGNADDDVWFEFTATNPSTTIKVMSSGNYNAVVELFNSSNVLLLCSNTTAEGFTETLSPTALTVGQQYFVRVYHFATGTGTGSGQFAICVSATPIPPINDNCANAISLPVVTNVFTTGSQTIAATASASIPACSVSGTTPDDDVWYSFIATNTTEVITVAGATGFNAVIQLFSGSCGSLTAMQCVNNLGNGQTEVLTATNLVKNQTYYIRVYHAGIGGGTGLFSINVSTPLPVCPGNTTPVSPTSNVNHVGTTLKWSPVPNANSYSVYLDVVNPPVQLLTTTVTDTFALTGQLSQGESYYWQVKANNTAGASSGCYVSTFATEPFDYALVIKVFVEGLYLSNQTMRSTMSLPDTIADTITVKLASPSTKQILWTTKATLNTTGIANALFPQPALGQTYYIVVSHRNSLDVWSQGTFGFNSPDTIYDFSTPAKAYGNNMVEVSPGVFALHSGDVNFDGTINQSDFNLVESSIAAGIQTGYINTDINGDGILESSDYSFIENKTRTVRTIQHP